MKRLLPLLILLASSVASAGTPERLLDDDAVVAAARAVDTARFPDADAVLVDESIRVAYRPDGTSETLDDVAIKILTERGRRENRTISVSFDVAYGSAECLFAEIVDPDGSVRKIDVAALGRTMIDPGQMSANIYDPNSKILQVSVPGLEPGDLLRYAIRRTETKTPVPGTWSDYQTFEDTAPILHETYRVVAPKSLPLRHALLKAEIPGTVSSSVSTNADSIVYEWTVSDVPRMFPEPDMPPPYTVVQRLLVGTIDRWETLSKWYWKLCKPRLEAVSPEMREKVAELTAGATNRTQRIRNLFRFVSQQIRYMGVTTEDVAPGYEPHDVRTTFENRFGVCRDKAALLVAMLRLADVDAFPVIIMVGPKKDEEVPQPYFNHAIVAALDERGDYVLMDPTNERAKDLLPAYLQDMSYLVARPEGDRLRTTPVIPARSNLLEIATTGTLSPAGALEARSILRFRGINDVAYRAHLSRLKPEEIRRFFEGRLKKSVPAAELRSFSLSPTPLSDVSKPLVVRLGYVAPDQFAAGGDLALFAPPRLGADLGYANFLIGRTGLEEREYPLRTGATAGIREIASIRIDPGAGIPVPPSCEPLDRPFLEWARTFGTNASTLSVTNLFLVKRVEFSPEEYRQLKGDLGHIEHRRRKKIVFDRSAERVAERPDVEILERDTSIDLPSPSNWTERIRFKARILTYAGKKDFSEIKIPYNPARQRVELLAAFVTAPDGTRRDVEPETINVMDAGWVAGAPRYPAGKLLVVNLPGVEIGSVVQYELRSTVDRKPFFSAIETFNGPNPVDRCVVRLAAPTNLPLTVRAPGIASTRSLSNGILERVWISTNQPGLKAEEDLPEWWTFNPALLLSAADRAAYFADLLDRLRAASENQPRTAALAKRLVENRHEFDARVLALRNRVAETIRPAGPAFVDLPLSALSPADVVLRDGYGNAADRMILLRAMLVAAGIEADFILSGTDLPLVPEAAQPLADVFQRDTFDAILLRVERPDGTAIYLGGASQYARLGATPFDRHPYFDLASGRLGTIRIDDVLADAARTDFDVRLDPDGTARIALRRFFQASDYETFRKTYAEITPENRRRRRLELANAISRSARADGPLVTDFDAYPGRLELPLRIPGFAVADRDLLYLSLPSAPDRFPRPRADRRALPLEWSDFARSRTDWTLRLPDGYDPVILPADFSRTAPAGAGTVRQTVEYDPGKRCLHVRRTVDLHPAILSPERYPDLLEIARRLDAPDAREILLRKTNDRK